jgi:two-component system, NtrC family, response regulator HydG
MKTVKSSNILVVDDDTDVLYTAKLILRDLVAKVDTLSRPAFIPECMRACRYDLILLDMNFSRGITTGQEGLEWLRKILEIDSETRVIATTAYGEIDLAVHAMKSGASDFILKPWNKEQLIASVRNIFGRPDQERLGKHPADQSDRNHRQDKYPSITSHSPNMLKVLETIETVAPTDANVLILGENGTGKEVVAWSLHCRSARKDKTFVHVDLGAIPETLFEAELFGHTKGAFTDAKEERAGRFEAASGGTLFLDEVGNLSLPMQAKLLTAVQSREIIRIGSNRPLPVNVRLISATNMPLYKMADSFEFRQDLLYRLNTVEIVVPPLRERKEDIPLLTDYFICVFSEQYGKKGLVVKRETRELLGKYHWPGNIRELAHSIERAVILNRTGELKPDDFVLKSKEQPKIDQEGPILKVEDYERIAITNALARNGGNLSKAADDLGVARTTLYRKIAYFGIVAWK